MIQFYKPNKKVTGSACSFWMNRDGSIMASMIKQDGWNDKTHTGSFAKNKENPNGRVVVKLGNAEVAGIIDVLESNREWSTYHQSSKQKLQIKFGTYNRNDEQVGYSFSVNKQDTEDSTNKVGFIIGFSFQRVGTLGSIYFLYFSNGFLLMRLSKRNRQRLRPIKRTLYYLKQTPYNLRESQRLNTSPRTYLKMKRTLSGKT